MTIYQMTQAIRSGELSSYGLVSQYISKIEANKHLCAVIELNPDSLEIAKRLDTADVKAGALYGVPILLKDNINTGDNMHTSAGSVALADNIAPEDAPLTSLLREAGAVILGKTNMTEFANYMSNTMPNGYSSRGGQTLHFYDQEADPSGSSTGSAVAVAAGLCAAAVGTETYGSIISPAQCAGIVGIKPTAGLVNSQGVIPISFTLDTPGPMARCVEDAGLLLGVLAGKPIEQSRETRLTGVRIGISRMILEDNDPEWIGANERLINVMRELGADCVEMPEYSIDTGFIYTIMRHEFKFAINNYLQSAHSSRLPKTLQEIIEYNERHSDIALKYGQDILVRDNASAGTMDPEYLDALKTRDAAMQMLDKLFDRNSIDVLFMLTANISLAAATGFPSMTIPLGKTSKGLPIGSFFVARRYKEDALLKTTSAVESALRVHTV